jgi:hypothetical protein
MAKTPRNAARCAERAEPSPPRSRKVRFGPATSAPPPTKVTVTPSGKPAVSGTLDYIDDFNVALWNSAGTYHSFTRTKDMKVDVRDPLQGHIDLLSKYTDDDMHNVLTYLVTLK